MSRQLQPCGTVAAYQRHRRVGETPCEPCRLAELAAQRERYRRTYVEGKERGEPQPCGTQAAYARHLRLREPACAACLEAHRVYIANWRKANGATA